jgi:hypothetical protein
MRLPNPTKTTVWLCCWSWLLLACCTSNVERYETAESLEGLLATFPKTWYLLTPKSLSAESGLYIVEPYEGQPTHLFFRKEQSASAYPWALVWKRGLEYGKLPIRYVELEKHSDTWRFFFDGHTLECHWDRQADRAHWRVLSASSPILLPADTLFTHLWDNYQTWRERGDGLRAGKEQGEWIALRGRIEPDHNTYAYICLGEQDEVPIFLKGVYFYEKFWRDLYLENVIDPTFQTSDTLINWHLQERAAVDAQRISGVFKGTTDYLYNFKGKWQSREDSSRILTFAWSEEILPFRVENHVETFELPDESRLCIQYPQLAALADTALTAHFNDSIIKKQVLNWQREFLAQKTWWKSYGDCQISINYHLFWANKNLISLLFYIRQGTNRTEYLAINYSLQDRKMIALEQLFEKESFEERVRLRSRRHVEVEEQRQHTTLAPYDTLTLFNNYNFLPANLRLTLYSREQNKFFPIYIPYKDLRFYLKKEAYTRLFDQAPPLDD